MRIVVHGQQAFGKAVLEALIKRGENVIAAYVAPEKPGQKIDPLKEAALAARLPIYQPASYRKPDVWEEFKALKPDLHRRLISTDRMMLAHVYLDQGAVVPKHAHENEQLTYILEGTLRFWLGEDEAEVIDVRSLVPLDARTILTSLNKTGRLFTVEENPRLLGWGAEIASIAAEDGFWDLDGPVQRITTPHIPLPAADSLEDFVIPSADLVAATVTKALRS